LYLQYRLQAELCFQICAHPIYFNFESETKMLSKPDVVVYIYFRK